MLVAVVCVARYPAHAQQAAPFRVEEATIAQIHEAMRARRVTARQVVQQYLDRIDAYDKPGTATECVDRSESRRACRRRRLGRAVGADRKPRRSAPRHPCHPQRQSRYGRHGDVCEVRWRWRILVRATMLLWFGGCATPERSTWRRRTSQSSLHRRTDRQLRPGRLYAQSLRSDRTTAGSSGGTAAAVAANFGAVGIGTDTGNSIRGPSSHQALVGLRPTVGLVSRAGVVPLDPSRDVTGPMTRTVTDAAVVLDAIAGVDPSDPMSGRGRGHLPTNGYVSALKPDGLRGARIGVLRQL